MILKTRSDGANCIKCYQEELLIYLVQRFGSLRFAHRVLGETQKRLNDSEVLNYVPIPHVYLINFALSVGLEFMRADCKGDPTALNVSIDGDTNTVLDDVTFKDKHESKRQRAGSGPWQP